MNHDILMSILGALITAIIGFIFWLIKRQIDRKDKNSIAFQYLEKFYAPIHNQIQSKQIITMVDAINSIDSILKNHPQAIPEYFMDWRKVNDYYIKYKYDEDELDNDFVNRIEANYIWLRRKFKYDKQKVSKENLHHLDCYEKKSFFAEILEPTLYVLLIALFFLGLLALDYKEYELTYICLSGSGFGIIVLLLKNYTNKWGD